MIAVTGRRTTIVQELAKITSDPIVRIEGDWKWEDAEFELPLAVSKFVFAAGHLVGKPVGGQTLIELGQTWAINCANVMRLCERALLRPDARIVVIGSESAILGSYDMAYAAAKAGIHAYCQTRKLAPDQSLTVISPPIISDSGMTQRRDDLAEILATRRTVTAYQVAAEVLSALNCFPEEAPRLLRL
jgi:NAD(P)-dependent dehydrogenase (short-subunit alcohol dehydrogenase family)